MRKFQMVKICIRSAVVFALIAALATATTTPTAAISALLADVYVSSSSPGTVDGISFGPEDILVYDTTTDTWAMFFDGSDVHLGPANVDGFSIIADGAEAEIVLSLAGPLSLPAVGLVDDSDVLTFVGAPGPTTSGTLSLLLDGSDTGLTAGGEDIDAIASSGPDFAVSTLGSYSVGMAGGETLSGGDEDLISLRATSTGPVTSGAYSLSFDGSDAGLTQEDIDAAWIDPATGVVYGSTTANFSVPGVTGDSNDIWAFTGATGVTTSGTFAVVFDGDQHRFGRENIDGLHIVFRDSSESGQADLSITTVDDVDPVIEGDSVTYTVTVANDGPDTAFNVVVTETLPDGVTVVSTSGCAQDPEGIPCSLGTIPAGASASYQLSVRIDDGTSGEIVKTATVTSGTPDPNLDNNRASENTYVAVAPVAFADGAVTSSAPGNLFHTALDTPLIATVGSAEDLLRNDSLGDPSASILSFGGGDLGGSAGSHLAGAAVSIGGTGTLLVNADGSFTFNPDTGFNGSFSFEYRLANPVGSSDATVNLFVGDRPFIESGDRIFLSTTSGGTVDNVSYGPEDILQYNTGTDSWSIFLDGSDIDLGGANIDGLAIVDNETADEVLFSLAAPRTIPGLGRVDDSDIIRFLGAAGETTTGSTQIHVDGSDIRLTTGGEDIDAFTESGGGLAISTVGNFNVPRSGGGSLTGADEDLAALTITSTGPTTVGTFDVLFDGSDVDLAQEDLSSVWKNPVNNTVLATSLNVFNVPELSGDSNDVFVFSGSLGATTSGTFSVFFDADLARLVNKSIDGLHIQLGRAPTITSDGASDAASLFVEENSTAVTDVQSTDDSDSEGAGLTYALTSTVNGADNDLFSIDTQAGTLNFKSPQDFEAPADADRDNDYETEVTVTDSTGLSDTQAITVTILDVEIEDEQADLSISITDSADPVPPAEAFAYTITVENAGPDDASDTEIAISLPAALTLTSTSGCVETPGGVPTCTVGSIAPGGAIDVVVNVIVDPAAVDSITIQASVSSSVTDPNPANDEASEETSVTMADPTVTIDSHIPDETVDIAALGRVPTLSGLASAFGSDIASVEVALGGGPGQEASLSVGVDGSTRWAIPFGAPTSGPVTFDVVATDTAGRTGLMSITLDVLLPDETETIYAPDVVVLSDATLDDLISGGVTADELTFLNDPGIKVGQVVLGSPGPEAPEGFAFRVTAVRIESSSVVLEVIQARLDEIFAAVTIDLDNTSANRLSTTPSEFASDVNANTVRTVTIPTVSFGGPPPIDIGGLETLPTGSIESTLTFGLDVKTNWLVFPPRPRLTEFQAIIDGRAKGDVLFKFEDSTSIDGSAKLIPSTTIWRTLVFVPGVPVPIPVEVDAELELKTEATFSLTAESQYSVAIPFTAGYRLNASGAIEPVAEYDLSGLLEPGVTSEVAGRIDAKVELITAFDLFLFSGPFAYQRGLVNFGLDFVPTAEGSVWMKDESPGPCWNIDIGYVVRGQLEVGFGLAGTDNEELIKDLETIAEDRETCKTEDDQDAGNSSGDPHIVTHDGLSYDFLAAGDHVLAASTEDSWQVQARFGRPTQPDVSFNRAVAATVGDSVISFGDDATTEFGEPLVPRLDGEAIVLAGTGSGGVALPGGATVRRVADRYFVEWPDGSVLRVDDASGGAVTLVVGAARAGRVGGLFGDADSDPTNDLQTSANISVSPYDEQEFYSVFGADWRREGAESLFLTPLDDLPVDEVFPLDPTILLTLADLPPEDVSAAEQICIDAGIEQGGGLLQCTLDIAVTGDTRFIVDDPIIAALFEQSIPAAAVVVEIEDDITIDGSTVVENSLDNPFVRDLIRIVLDAGDRISVAATEDCPGAGVATTFRTTIFDPAGIPLVGSTGPDCGTSLIEAVAEAGEYVIVAYDEGGFTGSYELDVTVPVPPQVDDQTFTIPAGAEPDDLLGSVAVTATDSEALLFALADTSVVDIDGATGELTLVSRDQLDTLEPSFDVVVTVTDEQTNVVSATLTFLIDPVSATGPALFPHERFALGPRPESMQLVDLTGDGILDVVAVSKTNGEIDLLEGLGAGRYHEPFSLEVGDQPTGLAIADLDGNGHLDFVVANQASEDLSIVLGQANSFESEVRISLDAGLRPTDVEAANVVGDDAIDLLVTTAQLGSGETDELILFEGDGTGGFTEFSRLTVGKVPRSVAVGDFTGDGKPDIVTANSSSEDVSIFRSIATGGLQAEERLSVDSTPTAEDVPTKIQLADHLADGDLDVFVLLERPGNRSAVRLFDHSVADQSFRDAGLFIAEFHASDFEVVDVTGDTLPDLVVINEISNDISILWGDLAFDFNDGLRGSEQKGRIDQQGLGSQRPLAIEVADVTGDGPPDLVIASSPYAGEVTVVVGTGSGLAIELLYEQPPARATSGSLDLRVVDVTDDGELDVVTLGDDEVIVHAGSGVDSSGFAPGASYQLEAVPFTTGDGPAALAVGDVTNDSLPDIVTANARSNDISILAGKGRATCPDPCLPSDLFEDPMSIDVGTNPRAVAIGDVTGDDVNDIVVVSSADNEITILVGSTAGPFTEVVEPLDGEGPDDLLLADVTGDGIADIIVSNSGSQSVEVLSEDPSGLPEIAQLDCDNFEPSPNPEDPSAPIPPNCSPANLAVGDLNGDGRPDLVVAYGFVDSLNVILADESGDLVLDEIVTVEGLNPTGSSESLLLADLDENGSLDIVARGAGTVVLPNDGDGGFEDSTRYGVGGILAVADISGDGALDIVTIGGGDGSGAGGSGTRITTLIHR